MKKACLLTCFALMSVAATAAISLDSFKPVHKGQVTKEGPNVVRLSLPSAEWKSGLAWQIPEGLDCSKARYLAVDVENLSSNRQARLSMHVSAGRASTDSDDHATAINVKNRSVNTGIGLNPGEKGTMKLKLMHPRLYEAPADARGPYVIDTSHVTLIELMMQWPFEDEVEGLAELRLSNLRLEGVAPKERAWKEGQYVPFVDRYGQFAHGDWRFKIHSDDELKADLKAELARLSPAPESWDRFGGWANGPKLKATGHFRTARVNGVWWLVTPEGHLFFSVGLDVTRVMTDITDATKHPDWYQGQRPADNKMAFTIWNLEKKFGKKDFELDYLNLILKRFDAWGLNSIGNWSAGSLTMMSKKPYVLSVLERAPAVPRHKKFHIYDFTAPNFEETFRKAIRQKFATEPALAHAAKDPMCIGFFIDNELQFQHWIPAMGEEAAKPYLDLYFRICREELSRLAPNKLYLGCRFVGFRQYAALWQAAARYCDVITVNAYGNSVYNISDSLKALKPQRPFMIGEFHFGCYDRGMFKPGLAPVWGQEERARSFTRFVEGCLQHPLFVGCHWFQYRDQPLLGRGDGEAYQIGFVDVCDRPYPELCRAARKIGSEMYEKRKNGVWPR